MRLRHRLVIEILRTSGELVGHAPLEPDWEPALEAARLGGLRLHGRWAEGRAAERAIDWLWNPDLGEPFLRGFRVQFADGAEADWHQDFTLRYFVDAARAVAAALVSKGALEKGATYLYRVLAYEADAAPTTDDGFMAVDVTPPLAVHHVADRWLDDAQPCDDDGDPDDFDVYLPAKVLEEASALTTAADEQETGGILIGHLARRSPTVGATTNTAAAESTGASFCVAISALVPARHTVQRVTTLTFTPDTWTDVRRAIELRHRGEMALGWFHSHPQFAWCRTKGCSPEAQQQCPTAAGFLSDEDTALHRAVFPRAFTVALVMTRSAPGIRPRLFGWRGGRLEPRGYRILAQPPTLGVHAHASTLTA